MWKVFLTRITHMIRVGVIVLMHEAIKSKQNIQWRFTNLWLWYDDLVVTNDWWSSHRIWPKVTLIKRFYWSRSYQTYIWTVLYSKFIFLELGGQTKSKFYRLIRDAVTSTLRRCRLKLETVSWMFDGIVIVL